MVVVLETHWVILLLTNLLVTVLLIISLFQTLYCLISIFFKVHEYDGSLSDHCKISVMLSVKCFIHCNENRFLKRLPCRYIWNDESPHKFQTALNLNEVQLLIQKFVSENPSLNETEIDKMMETFTEIIHVASDMALKKE